MDAHPYVYLVLGQKHILAADLYAKFCAQAVEERFTSLCYAGQLPGYTMGFNEHGQVFTINTLSPKNLKPGHTRKCYYNISILLANKNTQAHSIYQKYLFLPASTFMTRALLAAKNMLEADRILLDKGLGVANGFSVNFFWTNAAEEHTLRNVEVAPNFDGDRSLLDEKTFDEEALLHCNM